MSPSYFNAPTLLIGTLFACKEPLKSPTTLQTSDILNLLQQPAAKRLGKRMEIVKTPKPESQ
jgi:hypothetical protein